MARKKKPKLPLSICIPIPSSIPRARGIHSTNKFGDFFKARCSVDEKQLVQDAVDKLGIREAEFIRWSVVMVAKEIDKYSV